MPPAAVHVCVFAFDLLYRDGASLAHLPLSQRRRQLREAFPAMQPGLFTVAEGVEFAAVAAQAAEPDPLGGRETGAGGSGGDSSADASAGTPALEPGAAGQRQGDAAAAAGSAQVPAAALEDRLQECLLEAFAAGAGAYGPVLAAGWKAHACIAGPPAVR